ncbi:tRNA pseudouridine(13) synthase TruD [Solemya pervernicosa gill symbiont]|uniref:tRNA pseudouridine synthase D n=2 Tax=Gammaproteobacteria incertae sedis TaxID=118884 RepID=A0A1T2L846_9GAMM|nr:tRNA pseudouridine(13) synthase TruD [Candidatus Reidiella endopervernicosa]OOZ41204.1 tRNA pseudouridine(13) synthase TruD [Solemya pervernicosa gill symbiont]QKQ27069.1 tRNA pseudouridine(13) synthase TruD [Candidatus Reidiella endopervernicosa]
MSYNHDRLNYALGKPVATGRLKSEPADFRVDEIAGFEADGSGEHAVLKIEKKGLNTADVAKSLARLAGIKERDVGYAGLKDRVAVTTQWFSLYLPGQDDPEWSELESDQLCVLEATRHGRKIKRGTLRGNRFTLTLREVEGDKDALNERLKLITSMGVPNYFGEQRFGYQLGNLDKAAAMFAGRRVKSKNLRGLYISAARSMLFNTVLSKRIEMDNWNQLLEGEVAMLDGSRNFFLTETGDTALAERLMSGDIHPSAPMWGRGSLLSEAEALVIEEAELEPFESWRDGLEHVGLKQERRATRLIPKALEWNFVEDDVLELSFTLHAGCYATSVVRELLGLKRPE